MAKFKETGTWEDFINYKKAESKARVTIKKEKKKSFVNFCEKLNRFTNPTYIWEKVKCFKNRWTQITQRRTDAKTRKIPIDNNIDTLCAPWAKTEKPHLETDNQDEFLDRPYSLIELKCAIAKSKEKSAPGIDGIDYNLIKHFKERSKNYLLTLYNEILQSQTFPAEWTNYLIFFIPKSNSTKLDPFHWLRVC